MAIAGNLNFPTGDPERVHQRRRAERRRDAHRRLPVQLRAAPRRERRHLAAARQPVRGRARRRHGAVRRGGRACTWCSAGACRSSARCTATRRSRATSTTPGRSSRRRSSGCAGRRSNGITITFGGSFGAACGFGAPAIRFFNVITWQPKTSPGAGGDQPPAGARQRRSGSRRPHRRRRPRPRRAAGSPENFGCPDLDTDGDGIFDRDDKCPDKPAGPHGKGGCPVAFVQGDEIVITEQVHFATDKDIILEDSNSDLEAVAQVLIDNPDIREVRIEGHTDVARPTCTTWRCPSAAWRASWRT